MKCIYHIPIPLDPNAKSASGIRPQKMLQAFKDIGYDVTVVSGYAKERKKRFDEIKTQVKNGVKFDFLYSESSTMPTILTEPHHMPIHPFVDFSLFRFCKKNGIKIGLFYRDIYWKFDIYKKTMHGLKLWGALASYRYDLFQYGKFLDKLYVPDQKVFKFLDYPRLMDKLDTLPPGCEAREVLKGKKNELRNFEKEPLQIFYVGGLGGQYQISELLEAVKDNPLCEVTVCCRQEEWENNQDILGEYCRFFNIHIIHESGRKLDKYYEEADICSLLFKPDIYIEMAMPYKAFEYLSWLKPVLASKGTAIGNFVEQHDTGWVIEYTIPEIKKMLNQLVENPELLYQKRNACIEAKKENLWTMRAEKVAEDLK